MKANDMPLVHPALEKHCSVEEVCKLWGFSDKTVKKIFAEERLSYTLQAAASHSISAHLRPHCFGRSAKVSGPSGPQQSTRGVFDDILCRATYDPGMLRHPNTIRSEWCLFARPVFSLRRDFARQFCHCVRRIANQLRERNGLHYQLRG
jgi:hypothetical protein